MPTAWAIRPQLGSPPFSAVLTSGELATARATRLDVPLVAAAHDDAPDPARRPRRRARSSARAGAAARRAPRRSAARPRSRAPPARRAAPEAMQDRGVVGRELAVDADAVERALDATPSSRSARLGVERGVGLHEAQQRGEVRRDHPRALGLRAEPHGARRAASTSQRGALVERVGGADRLGEVGVAVRRRSSRGASRMPSHARVDRQLARRSRRSRRPPPGLGSTRRPPRPRPASSRPRRARGRPVAALALPELATTARRRSSWQRSWRQQHRRGEHARAGEARGARRRRRASETSRPTSGSPLGLIPHATPGGAEARAAGRPASSRDVRRAVDPARAEEGAHDDAPRASGSPNIRLRFCTACEAVPFQRLSIAAKTSTLPVRSSRVDARCGRCWCRARRARPGGASASSTNGSSRVGVGVTAPRSSPSADVARRRHVAGHSSPWSSGTRCGMKVTGTVGAERAPAPGRSRARGGAAATP